CCAGLTEAGKPDRIAVGGAGRLTFNVNRSDTLARALSVTVIATPKFPAAVGVPPIWPVVALIVRPDGNPAALQRYGGCPPEAATLATYAWFRMPSGSCLGVVSDSPGALIVRPTGRLVT